MKKIFYVFLLIFSHLFAEAEISMPLQEQKRLEAFFEILIKDYNFAFTLFGNKPCSIACYREKTVFFDLSFMNATILREGWESWMKVEKDFPSKQFALRKIYYENDNLIGVLIINKNAVLEVLRKNYPVFEKTLHISIPPESILKNMLENERFLQAVLYDSELLGILLGYGGRNASSFKQRTELCSWVQELSASPVKVDLAALSPTDQLLVGLSSLDVQIPSSTKTLDLTAVEKLNRLTSNVRPFQLPGSDILLEAFQSPLFMSFSDAETKELEQSYLETRKLVLKEFRNQSTLPVVLNQWMKQ
jgi:hypothetical protein